MTRIDQLIDRIPELEVCRETVALAGKLMIEAYERKHKVLLCGNGGSCCDAEHIVGELMKGFCKKRPLASDVIKELEAVDPYKGAILAKGLQTPLRAINLAAHIGVGTAFANDVAPEMVFAQQVLGYGDAGDVLIGLSTSGDSENVRLAGIVARAQGLRTIGLTGEKGCAMDGLFDVVIHVPTTETYLVQEYHLPIYHALCLMVEEHFFEV